MNIIELKRHIRKEIYAILEADDDKQKDKVEKEKQDLEKQKLAFNQNKLDFQKKKEKEDDREQDQEREAEQDKEQEQGTGEEEQKPEPNISFKTQGDFYKEAMANIKNLTLSDGNLLTDEEKNYIALAIESANGRFDGGFVKYLKRGKAGNVKGKDFSTQDLKKIIRYVRENDLVR